MLAGFLLRALNACLRQDLLALIHKHIKQKNLKSAYACSILWDNGELKMEATRSRYKYPLEYELNPTSINKGNSWLTLKLKNISKGTLKAVDIQLHSLDTYYLTIYGTWHEFGAGQYLKELKPNEQVELVFRVNALGSADVYATIMAREVNNNFWWESGWTHIYVSEQKAELERLLVLSHPYTQI
jgi:hypothetical protein